MRKIILLVFLVFNFLPEISQAQFYVRPRAGAIFPVDGGDASYALGASLGYSWTSFLSTEASYSRLVGTGNTGSGDEVLGQGIVTFPLAFLNPYVSAGVGGFRSSIPGGSDWSTMFVVGGGAMFNALPLISVGAGVNYLIVDGGSDYVEPVAAVGFHF